MDVGNLLTLEISRVLKIRELKTDSQLIGLHPESLGMGWAGTSPKPLVIGYYPSHGSGSVLDSGDVRAVVSVP